MTRYFLSSVSIEGFRGINNDGDPLILNFRSDAVNSVHAPNGHGKSSIFEALCYAIHGIVPRLASLQGAEQGESYVVNKFHVGQQATIALVFASDDGSPEVQITVTRSAGGARTVTSASGAADPERFLASLREDFVLVDYGSFHKFIDSSALDRGRSFASLVGLSRYSRLRQSLDRAKDTRNMNADLGIAAAESEVAGATLGLVRVGGRVLSAHNEITGQDETELRSIDDLEANVTRSLSTSALLQPFFEGRTVMDLDYDAAERKIEEEEGGAARRRIEELESAIASLTPLEVGDDDRADIDRLIALATARDEAVRAVGAASMHALLRDALVVVESADWTDPLKCPVCDAESGEPLKERLEAKLALYEEAARLDGELSNAVRGATSIEKLRLLEEAAAVGVAYGERVHIGLLQSTQLRTSVTTAGLERGKTQLAMLEERRRGGLESARAEIAALQQMLPPSLVQLSRMLALGKQFRDAVLEYRAALPPLNDKKAILRKVLRWKAFINAAAALFSEAETALSNERIEEIQTVCQGLFATLVRGGPDVKPTLSRAANSEQVDLRLADFFGLENQSARALLSESYRNAVAAAIFLSAATKHKAVPRFMVLDDVTSSFDAGHQFSLMDAIRTQLRHGVVPHGLQFIILSHDASLEKYFDSNNNTADWHHQKLQGMPPRGRIMAATQEADRLKAQALHYLNAGMVDVGERYLRQYLEYKLGQIISRLEIPVPPDYVTRGDKRTLSTYMNAITSAVDLFQAANRCVLEARQITDLTNNYAPSIIANYVSHYETGAGNPFNAYALIGVIQSVDSMADCFTYQDAVSGNRRYYRRLDRR